MYIVYTLNTETWNIAMTAAAISSFHLTKWLYFPQCHSKAECFTYSPKMDNMVPHELHKDGHHSRGWNGEIPDYDYTLKSQMTRYVLYFKQLHHNRRKEHVSSSNWIEISTSWSHSDTAGSSHTDYVRNRTNTSPSCIYRGPFHKTYCP